MNDVNILVLTCINLVTSFKMKASGYVNFFFLEDFFDSKVFKHVFFGFCMYKSISFEIQSIIVAILAYKSFDMSYFIQISCLLFVSALLLWS